MPENDASPAVLHSLIPSYILLDLDTKMHTQNNIMVLFSCLILLTVLSSACTDTRIEMAIRRNGSLDMDMHFTMEQTASQFGRGFGSDEPWPIPLTEKDFRLQAQRTGGVVVKKYSRSTTAEGTDGIHVKLRAESVAAAANYLDWNMVLEENAGSTALSIIIPATADGPQNEESREELEKLLEGGDFHLQIAVPKQPYRVIGGTVDGRKVVFSTTLNALAFSDEPVTWSLTW